MNRREIINLLVFVSIAIFQSQVVAQSNSVEIRPEQAAQSTEQIIAQERLLVLKNGNVISGRIEETGKEVIIETVQGSRLVIATEQADFICTTREEAYWGKLSRTQASDLRKQVALFHWCLNQKLLTEAQNQLDILQASALSAVELDRLNRGLEYSTRQEAVRIQEMQVAPKNDVSKLADASLPQSESQRHVDPRFLTPLMPTELTAPYRLVPLVVKDKLPDANNFAITKTEVPETPAREDRQVIDSNQARLKNSKQTKSLAASSVVEAYPPPTRNPQAEFPSAKMPQATFRAIADEKPFSGHGALSLSGSVGSASFENAGNSSFESAPFESTSTADDMGFAGDFPADLQRQSPFIDGIDPVFTPLPKMELAAGSQSQPIPTQPIPTMNFSKLVLTKLPAETQLDNQLEPLAHVIPTANHPADKRQMDEPKFAAIRSPNDPEPTRLVEKNRFIEQHDLAEENRVIQVGYSEAIANSASSAAASPPTKKFVAATIPELQELTRSMPEGSLTAFRQQVENILVRNCARCHDSKSADMPLMHAGRYKNIPRRMSQRNLHSILSYSNSEDPLASSILDLATTIHGGADAAGLSKESKEFVNLKKWLIMVSDHPELAAEGDALASDGDSSDAGRRLQEPPKLDASRIDAMPLNDLDRPGAQKSGAAPEDGFTPRDEFDPEIFNRTFGDGSK